MGFHLAVRDGTRRPPGQSFMATLLAKMHRGSGRLLVHSRSANLHRGCSSVTPSLYATDDRFGGKLISLDSVASFPRSGPLNPATGRGSPGSRHVAGRLLLLLLLLLLLAAHPLYATLLSCPADSPFDSVVY
jgi:hypothetical protein